MRRHYSMRIRLFFGGRIVRRSIRRSLGLALAILATLGLSLLSLSLGLFALSFENAHSRSRHGTRTSLPVAPSGDETLLLKASLHGGDEHRALKRLMNNRKHHRSPRIDDAVTARSHQNHSPEQLRMFFLKVAQDR